MAIIKNVKNNGNQMLSSNDGKIIIDSSAGDIIVRDSSNTRRYYLGSERSPSGFGQYISVPGVDVVEELES